MELMKIANRSGALTKDELSDLLANMVTKAVSPEEMDLIFPAMEDASEFNFNMDEFQNIMHVLY